MEVAYQHIVIDTPSGDSSIHIQCFWEEHGWRVFYITVQITRVHKIIQLKLCADCGLRIVDLWLLGSGTLFNLACAVEYPNKLQS